MQRVALCVLLLIMGLLSLVCLGCEHQVTSGLNIQNAEQARASEIIIIKTIDNAGNPVSGARIYSPDYLGDTTKDGTLFTFFREPGAYKLVARKGKAGEPGFSEAKGMIRIILGPVELQAFDGIPPIMPPGKIYPGEQHYKPGMIVRFSLRNICDKEVVLNTSAPWRIQSLDRKIVFEPIALQTIVRLSPGEIKEWTWNQKDKDNKQVNEGGYILFLKCSGGEYGLRFWIIPEAMTP